MFYRPSVTVVIPTFNRLELLANAIRSVLNQTYQDFEIIVVDDASTESVESLIESISDPRIRLVQHSENLGEAASRNTALQDTRGKYVAFLDDDDEWFPEKLSKQVKILESAGDEVAATYTAFLWFSWPEQKLVGSRCAPVTNGNFNRKLMVRNVVGTPSTVMVRKECLDKIGHFDPSIAYGVDHDLWMRIATSYRFHYIPEYLVKCHIHDNRLTNNLDILIQGQKDMLRKYPPIHSMYRSYHSRRCLSLGEKLCLNRDVKRGKRLLISSIRFKPTNWRSYFDLFLLAFGYRAFVQGRKIRQSLGRYVRTNFGRRSEGAALPANSNDRNLPSPLRKSAGVHRSQKRVRPTESSI